ncbi:flagellar export protein FliJ [Clostridium uliginosum]|uniref:Flagellar FliJ protein n=1 Tax=Clostridium uliginosum TaxID=119641 RepID=A0A1I1KLR5_9CLOT|nr:flagellar export protein FliJ [Clostridium uliginosum]SFC61212.1 flagellar FliJ protein [Clostridium uliginosum]
MAQRFKFGLEKLLEIRLEKEEECKRLFTEVQKEKKNAEEKLYDLKDSYDKYKGIKPEEDIIYQKLKRYYLLGVQNGIEQTEKELVIKTEKVDEVRKDLIEKQVDRKTVETLKEKQFSTYTKEEARVEQVNLDEIALYSYMRNSIERR